MTATYLQLYYFIPYIQFLLFLLMLWHIVQSLLGAGQVINIAKQINKVLRTS